MRYDWVYLTFMSRRLVEKLISAIKKECLRDAEAFFLFLQNLGDIVDQPLGLFPTETGVGDRLTVDILPDLLAAILKIALDHQPLDVGADGFGMTAGVEHLLGNTDLL